MYPWKCVMIVSISNLQLQVTYCSRLAWQSLQPQSEIMDIMHDAGYPSIQFMVADGLLEPITAIIRWKAGYTGHRPITDRGYHLSLLSQALCFRLLLIPHKYEPIKCHLLQSQEQVIRGVVKNIKNYSGKTQANKAREQGCRKLLILRVDGWIHLFYPSVRSRCCSLFPMWQLHIKALKAGTFKHNT